MCIRDRILIRVDNPVAAGREGGDFCIEKLAADTRSKYPRLLQGYGGLAAWAKPPIGHGALATIFGRR